MQRELPIRPDHVGITVQRDASQQVQLLLSEVDGKDEVVSVTPESNNE